MRIIYDDFVFANTKIPALSTIPIMHHCLNYALQQLLFEVIDLLLPIILLILSINGFHAQ
jgi:hypothetical protein